MKTIQEYDRTLDYDSPNKDRSLQNSAEFSPDIFSRCRGGILSKSSEHCQQPAHGINTARKIDKSDESKWSIGKQKHQNLFWMSSCSCSLYSELVAVFLLLSLCLVCFLFACNTWVIYVLSSCQEVWEAHCICISSIQSLMQHDGASDSDIFYCNFSLTIKENKAYKSWLF